MSLFDDFLKTSEYARTACSGRPELLRCWDELEKRKTQPPPDREIFFTTYSVIPDEDIYTFLRSIKQFEITAIMMKEFLGLQSVKETILELSYLADFFIHQAVVWGYREAGPPFTLEELESNLFILALGKLGGLELNISSDIDLIFLCSDPFSRDYEKNEALHRVLHHAMDCIRKVDEGGFLYRLDLRLRPEGDSGPLVMGLNPALEYYKKRGRLWEFQAFMKSRLVWGSSDLFNFFHIQMEGLIYSSINPEIILKEIKASKDKIEKKSGKNPGGPVHIKYSPGGIRDIEFITQFLQMVHGRRHRELRKGNTLEGLGLLHTYNLLSHQEYTMLRANYLFFRKLENILQFEFNTSRGEVPNQDERLTALFFPWNIYTKGRGEEYPRELRVYINSSMNQVRSIFLELFNETIDYLQIKNNLLDQAYDIPREIIESHFKRMDSEYFLTFDIDSIYHHLKMYSKLNGSHLCEVAVTPWGDDSWRVVIAAFDYNYEFAKIAGLISLNNLAIKKGEFHTYSEDLDSPKKRRIYSYFRSKQKKRPQLERKKIIGLLYVTLQGPGFAPPEWETFKKDLQTILQCLENNNNLQAEDFLQHKFYSSRSQGMLLPPEKMKPLEIDIDNESSRIYTILTVRSSDMFAFLYTFTNVLAMRGYYIFKIEIDTVQGIIFDRFFIKSGDGSKITNREKLYELKVAVMLIQKYSPLLYKAANPGKGLRYFNDLLSRVLESSGKDGLPVLGQKDVQEKLVRLFGMSDFIWEDMFRLNYKTMLPLVNDHFIEKNYTFGELIDLFNEEEAPFDEALNHFKDTHMFRIDLRQIFQKTDFWYFAEELTVLAEVIIHLSFSHFEKILMKRYGFDTPPPFAVLGLGKLGGRELGYASDIEMMIIYDLPPAFSGKQEEGRAYFEEMVRLFLKTLRSKREGVFEIDLNLRPYGKAGSLAVPLSTFTEYFSSSGGARQFERQALVKGRIVFSNSPGEKLKSPITEHVDSFVFSGAGVDLEELFDLRKKQSESYIKNPGLLNVKYSPGGLVDIEYFVQVLQMARGKNCLSLRHTATLGGLKNLADEHFISEITYSELREAYVFYRNLINCLRMVKGNARDLSLYPPDSLEYGYLIKRLFQTGILARPSKDLFREVLERHIKAAHGYFVRLGDYL